MGVTDEATVQVQRIDASIGTYHRVKTGTGEIGGIAAQAAATQRAATRIRLAKTQDVIALAKMADGSIVQASATVKVTIGGCGG